MAGGSSSLNESLCSDEHLQNRHVDKGKAYHDLSIQDHVSQLNITGDKAGKYNTNIS